MIIIGCLKRAHVQEAVEDASLQALVEVLVLPYYDIPPIYICVYII